jgi:hypothetical protein
MRVCCIVLALALATISSAPRRMESSPIVRLPGGTAALSLPLPGQPKNRLRLRTPHGDQHPWEDAERIVSNGGEYVVFLRTEPSLIPENEEFAVTIWVLPRNAIPPQPVDDISLDVDAFMPEHGHGMNRVPEITKREDGGFDAKGLLLHMGGNWELYFDVTRGAITERAQKRVVLE